VPVWEKTKRGQSYTEGNGEEVKKKETPGGVLVVKKRLTKGEVKRNL